ncbi:hypothetical protein ACHAWF_001989 [Thalassiosira exigua]
MGWTSFHQAWIRRQLSERRRGGDGPNDDRGGGQASARRLAEYWRFVYRVLLSGTRNIRPHDPPSTPVLVHRCAQLATNCPRFLLEWVVDPLPYNGDGWVAADLSAASTDTLGTLPLHRAMEATDMHSCTDNDADHDGEGSDYDNSTSTPAASGETFASTTIVAADANHHVGADVLYNNPQHEHNRVQIIEKLLRWHPKAATTPFFNGRSPLIQAIAHGGTWHQMGYRKNCVVDCDRHKGLLQLLWEYAREQFLEKDPITGLYPFMLAATIRTSRDRPKRLERERDRVDTVYNLLRVDPQFVAGVPGTSK